jgi:hypothetical protein
MDLGGGKIDFIINGEEGEVLFSDSSETPLDCNSIFFVDSSYLNQAVYINRNRKNEIINGGTSGIDIVDAIKTTVMAMNFQRV